MKFKPILILIFFSIQLGFSLQVPPLNSRVNDYAGILDSTQRQTLENLLEDAENQTTSQFVLLTIKSLEGEQLEDFSMQVAEKWKIGQKGLDNGVILLVAMEEKKIRIEVGYGLESILTDAKCGYIIRNFMVGQFRNGNYYQGIHDALVNITGIVNKEFDISPEELERFKKAQKKKNTSFIPFWFFIFLIFVLSNIFRGKGGKRRGGSTFWTGGFGSGGGGSSGGGGFSGGGGSFGGGGASGGW